MGIQKTKKLNTELINSFIDYTENFSLKIDFFVRNNNELECISIIEESNNLKEFQVGYSLCHNKIIYDFSIFVVFKKITLLVDLCKQFKLKEHFLIVSDSRNHQVIKLKIVQLRKNHLGQPQIVFLPVHPYEVKNIIGELKEIDIFCD